MATLAAHKRPQDYADTPQGYAQRWAVEIEASRAYFSKWHEQGEEITRVFLDERSDSERGAKRVNLFTSTVQIQRSLVYGKTPEVEVRRAFADAQDDVARVAGLLLERALNDDIQRPGDSYAEALGLALDDRQLRGQGQGRIRYEPTFESVNDASGQPEMDTETGEPKERKTAEAVPTDYVFWKDMLRSPARTEAEVRWVAFRAELAPEDVEARWGKKVADALPYSVGAKAESKDEDAPNPWQRAEVWEVWDRTRREVVWWVDGHDAVLEVLPDPLQLAGFFPCPRPMRANPVTGTILPRPDYCLAEDLYCEVNELAERMAILTRAIRVTGAYDGQEKNLANILTESGNKLYPVENWAMFGERGGIRGSIDIFPLEQIAQCIQTLGQEQERAKQQLYEVTGMSDLVRGQAAEAGVTATEQRSKVRFASTRLRQQQEEFARFASEVQSLKAEVICRLFDDATIQRMANAQHLPGADRALVPQALALLREDFLQYRVRVDPDSVAMEDFAAQTQEALEVTQAVTQFMAAATPVVQQLGPSALPVLLELLQAVVARLKGADALEGILDSAIMQAKQAAAQPQQAKQPDPKTVAQQMKGQQEAAKDERAARNDMLRIEAEKNAKMELEQNQTRENVKEALAKEQIRTTFNPPEQRPGGEM